MSLGSLIKVGKFGKLKFRTLAADFQKFISRCKIYLRDSLMNAMTNKKRSSKN